MAILPVLGLATVLVYLGQRLVRSGIGVRGAEVWLGSFFLVVAAGLVVRFALAMGLDIGVDPATANIAAQAAIQVGTCAFAAFVWQTFRPAECWARRLWLAVCALFTINFVLFYVLGAHRSQSHPFQMVLSASLGLVFAWGFVESLLYYRRMRLRWTLGLADPMITNRFLLFSAWTGACMLLPFVVTIVRAISFVQGAGDGAGESLAVRPESAWTLQVIRLAVVVLGPILAGGTWLCFFPTRRYGRWIEARAQRRGESGRTSVPSR